MNLRTTVVMATLLLLAPLAHAGEWYRFRNEQGVMVLANSIPPSLVENGYSVVGDDGRVLRVVPSRQEAIRQRAEDEARRAREEVSASRQRADDELLKLYASPADVEAAMQRKLNSIESDIARIRADLESLRGKKSDLESRGAERERAGQPPSPEVYGNLQIVSDQIGDRERSIAARRLEQQQVRESFDRDLQRVRLLLGVPEPVDQPTGVPVSEAKTAAATNGH